MSFALAFLLSLQNADRAVLVRTAPAERIEFTDRSVLRRLEPLMKDDRAPLGTADWTVSLYQGDTLIHKLKVLTSGSRQPIVSFLHDVDRVRGLSKQLADDSYEIREKASRGLIALGRLALDPIRTLSGTATDVEVRSRATRIVKEIHAAARPRVQVRFLFARKDRPAAAPESMDEWIRTAAADQGYPAIETTGATEWADLGLEKATLFPAVETGKPGGLYVHGKIAEWTIDGAVVIETTCSIHDWKSGRFSLDPKNPKKLMRLSNQANGDLFLAVKIEDR
jgi:hypothetical protein